MFLHAQESKAYCTKKSRILSGPSSIIDSMTTETIADRIRQIRRELGNPSQESFGQPLDVSKQAVGQWENGLTAPAADTLLLIEIKYGYRARWVQFGELPKLVKDMSGNEPSNVSQGPPIRGKVPLISWVRAGKWKEAIDLYEPGDAEVWIETTVPIKEHTFVLRVEGDSMEPVGEDADFSKAEEKTKIALGWQ